MSATAKPELRASRLCSCGVRYIDAVGSSRPPLCLTCERGAEKGLGKLIVPRPTSEPARPIRFRRRATR